MGSGKTRRLIGTWHNYKKNARNVILLKPLIDTKGDNTIVSRNGEKVAADYLIANNDNIFDIIHENSKDMQSKDMQIDCVLVDEVQFLAEHHIKELANVVDELGIKVICFGLKNDFMDNLFPGSAAILAICDRVEEIESICTMCGAKATVNARYEDGVIQTEGEQVVIAGENNSTYIAMCRKCKKSEIKKKIKSRYQK